MGKQNEKPTIEENNVPNLYEKIMMVGQEIMNIEKDMTVGKGNYAYKAVSDNVVTIAVKRAEIKHRLVSIPIKQDLIESRVVNTVDKQGKETIIYVDNIKMVVRFVDLDKPENYVDVESLGKGIDRADKGFGKASTYARKYALLNAYKIATGEDPDGDKSEPTNVPKTVNEKMVTLKNYFAKNEMKLPALLQHFGVDSLDDMNDDEINLTYKTYNEKNLL